MSPKTDFRRGLLVFSGFFIIFSCVGFASAYTNINNGDFESNYTGWSTSGIGSWGGPYAYWGGSCSVTYYSTGSYDNSGNVRVYSSAWNDDGESGSTTLTCQMYQSVDVTGYNTLYFWAKGTGSYVYIGSKSVYVWNTSWNKYSIDVSDLTGSQTLKAYASSTAYDGGSTVTHYVYVDHFYFDSDAASPDVSFTASPTIGTPPLAVQFNDTSSEDPTSWSWDFGDGYTSTDQNPEHTYDSAGTYTVSLEATNEGGSDTETKTDYITIYAPVSADFTANTTTVSSAHPIGFTDTSIGTGIDSWAWDFNGDGVVDSTVQNPVVTYGTAGEYTVSLTASSSTTETNDTETKINYITITDTGGCIACNFDAVPTSGYTPLTVQFTDLSAVEPDTWSWNFGDGHTSTEQNPEHEYTEAGTYTVTMTVSKGDVIKTKTKTGYITVTDYISPGGEDPGPYSCNFVANVTYGNVPLTVLFNDTSLSGADTWTWGIDGVYQADTQDVTITFNEAGIYSINHAASGPAGSGSKTKTNYIQVYPANYGGIYGYIFDADTSQPISNVNCQFSNTSATASILSDSDGYYYFWPVYNGIYDLTVSKSGYTTGTLPNTIINGTTLRQDIYLTQSGDLVQDQNITNYTSDWLTFDLTTDQNTTSITLNYEVTQGTTTYANCTIYSDSGPVYSSNVSTQSGTFSFAGSAGNNYLVSFDIMNSAGNRYSGAYPVLFYRGFPSSNPIFPPDMPQGVVNGILVFAAIVCMMMFGKAYIEIGMILGTAVLASSYIWGFLNFPESIKTPVIIFLSALVAGGEYIAKKKVLG
jgi:PKD repeat protein